MARSLRIRLDLAAYKARRGIPHIPFPLLESGLLSTVPPVSLPSSSEAPDTARPSVEHTDVAQASLPMVGSVGPTSQAEVSQKLASPIDRPEEQGPQASEPGSLPPIVIPANAGLTSPAEAPQTCAAPIDAPEEQGPQTSEPGSLPPPIVVPANALVDRELFSAPPANRPPIVPPSGNVMPLKVSHSPADCL